MAIAEHRTVLIETLREQVRGLERGAGGAQAQTLPLGDPALDLALHGGLPLACLHEVEPGKAEWDDGAAAGFSLALLARLLAGDRGRVLWVGPRLDLYGPGLADFGLDPGWFILARVRGERDALWALEEGLRCPALAAVVGEVGALKRTASRRLQLAAEAGGVTCLLLRRPLRPSRDKAEPSAAVTRWRVAAAPSEGTPGLIGPSRWRAELLRCRGGIPGAFIVEWNHATGDFALAAAVCDRPLGAAASTGRRLAG